MAEKKEKNCWEMTNNERLRELGNLFFRAEEVLESFSRKDYNQINTGSVYCLPNCIKWAMQCIAELKGTIDDE